MAIQLIHFSDCGPVRTTNQDAYCAFSTNTWVGTYSLLVVCDGMGGLSQGEVASATVVQDFANWFIQELPVRLQEGTLSPEAVFASWNQTLQECHHRLKRAAEIRQIRWGTTLSLVLLTPDSYYVLHIGDSRVYLENGAELQLLTKDQTLAMRELEAGRISAEQYAQDPRKNVLLQCIGDRFITPAFRIGIRPACGSVLLCSDGFYHTIPQAELHQILLRTNGREELQQQVFQLAARARQWGETDNMTVVILRWDNTPSHSQSTLPLSKQETTTVIHRMDCVAKVISIHAKPLQAGI